MFILGIFNEDFIEKFVCKECFLEIFNIFFFVFLRFVENKILFKKDL